MDQDGDGWDATVDCNDNDPALNLDDTDGDGASTCDGDCDDLDPVLNKDDADGDLADTCEGDCDDQDPSVSPYLQETCNDGKDNDCDGTVNDCVLSGQYDLYAVGEYLVGGENHDQAGSAIAGAGDLNGDGFGDLVVGAHLADPGYFAEGGAAFVVQGPVTGGVDLGVSAVRLAGETTGTWAGFAVAGGCDIDDDGNDDILVGAPERDINGTASGVAYLELGPIPADGNLASSDARLLGMHAEDRAGYALDCRGDTDGDGYDDMLVGAPGDDAGGTDAGAAFLVRGPMWGDFDLDAPDAGLLGEGPGDVAGSAVAMAGDTDSDGFDDLLVGAYQADAAAIDAGAVYLFRGPTLGIASLATADARITGEAAGDLAGWSVAAAGDVNGDGFDDLLIGARGESTVGSLSGAAYLLLGPVTGQVSLTAADAKMVGEAAQDYAGTSVAGVGDVNGDGFDDLMIGAPGNDNPAFDAGAAYLFHGPVAGYHTLDLADAKMIGWDAFDEAGTEVAAAGDVDGDGYDDMFVGSPFCDAGGLDAGAAYMILGVGL